MDKVMKAEIEKILLNMFEETEIGYDKEEDRFTGLITLPNKAKHQATSSLTALIIKWLEGKKDGYARGLCEQIGSLLMASEGMREGFKEYKSLKEIERQRNIGYNQLITELIGEVR